MFFNKMMCTILIAAGVVLCSAAVSTAQIEWNLDTEMGDVNEGTDQDPQFDRYSIEFINEQGGIIVGDKLFSNFDVFSTNNAPDDTEIAVRGLVDDDGNLGIEFVGFWDAFAFGSADSNVEFKVTVLDPNFVINGVRLFSNAIDADNGGTATILENIFDEEPGFGVDVIVDPDSIFEDSSNGIRKTSTEIILEDGYTMLWIRKDIGVNGGSSINPLSEAHISHFAQTFIQIPEPASLALLGAGVMLLVRRRRRA